MALSVAVTRIVLLSPDTVFAQWDIRGAIESGTYVVELQVAPSPEGPWLPVAAGANMYNAVHKFPSDPLPATHPLREHNALSLARQPYYKVVVTPPAGIAGQVQVITAVEPGLSGRQKNARRKMLRDARVLMSRGNGVPVAVCKKARWGNRCTECVDVYTGDVVRGECLACYGTGYIPGYLPPVITYARRSPQNVQSQISEGGKTDTNTVSITMLDIPYVQDDDMLVFLRDNTRFLVKASGQTELQTVAVHQELVASELARSSIEYRFPVDPHTVPALF